MRWSFGEFILDPGTRQLLRGTEPVALSPKAFQLLELLVRCGPKAVSKTDLQDGLWPGTFVVEKNLANLVGEIRRAIGDDAARPRFIRTVARFGYAFCEARGVGPEDAPPRRRTPPATVGELRHNLPEPVTSFIGREREIAELVRALSSTRLLTLTGAGGCGKTRLALEVARELLDEFPDGVWFVDLAPVVEPALVVQTVAATIEVRQAPNRSLLESVAERLRARHTLLILDNCEHLITASATVSETLLRAVPRLTILATSRETLGIGGETTWRVPSLSLPDPQTRPSPTDLLQYEAVRLLVERAAAIGAGLTATPANAAVLTDVCRRLDGIPLAIELAAARLNVLSLEQLHARLHDRFRLLARAQQTTLARHRTLEATIDWSCDLLPESERRLLTHLSVFAGGWTLEAAEQVCARDGLDRMHVLDGLSRLVDKSLVQVEEDVPGAHRYRYLESVKEYACGRLQQSLESEALLRQHFEYFLGLVRRVEPELTRADQLRWLRLLQSEHDNLRAALEWGLTSNPAGGTLELATRLHYFWLKRGYFAEGQHWLERALASSAAPPTVWRARALVALGAIVFFQGDFARARSVLAEGAELARATGMWRDVAFALGIQALAAFELGDFADGARLADEVAPAARAADAPWLETISMSFRAYEALRQGDIDRAEALQQDVLARLRERGELWAIGIALFDLALLRVVQERHSEARALCAEAIALGQQFGDLRSIAWSFGVLAGADAAEGRPARAATLRGAMEGLLDSIGSSVQPSYNAWIGDRYFGAVRDALGMDVYEDALTHGRAMSLSQAIEYSLQ